MHKMWRATFDAGNSHVRDCEGWGRQRPHLLGHIEAGHHRLLKRSAERAGGASDFLVEGLFDLLRMAILVDAQVALDLGILG